MRITIMCILVLLNFNYSLPQQSVKYDSLFIVKGEEYYRGKADCSTTVSLSSIDSTLNIDISVIDDSLIFETDSIGGDHAEIWLALPQYKYGTPFSINPLTTSYIWDNENQLYIDRDEGKLEEFIKEINSPTLIELRSEEVFPYDSLLLYEDWLKDEADEFLADVRRKQLKIVPLFFGITHLGIFPFTNKAVLNDKEKYSVLEQILGLKIPDLSTFVKFKTVQTPGGYTIKITLPPEAIGFSTKYGLRDFNFMVELFDADGMKKNTKVFSSVPKQKHEKIADFDNINISPSLKVNLYPPISELGGHSTGYRKYSPLVYISDYFLFTDSGWVPVDILQNDFNVYNKPYVYIFQNINLVEFKKGKLGYRSELRGKDTIEFLTSSNGEYIFVNNRSAYSVKDTVNSFLLSDSTVALLITAYETSGTFVTSSTHSLLLVASSDEQQIAQIADYDNFYFFIDSVELKKEDVNIDNRIWDALYEDEPLDWSKLFTWEEYGKSLIFDLGKGIRFRVSWDSLAQNIKYKKL